jgi:hypothetical protein
VDGRDQLQYPVGRVLHAPAVGESTGLGFARISADGKRVAFVQYRNPISLLGRLAIVDQSGAVTYLSNEYPNIHGLAWKGDEIVYTAGEPLQRAMHAVTPGGGARTITRVAGNVTLWDARPDGRLVTAHTDDHAIMIAELPGPDGIRDLSWLDAPQVAGISRDGKLVLFTEFGQGGGADGSVYLRGTDGSPAVRLGAGRAAALSPDGRWALCLSTSAPSQSLDLLPTGAGEPRRLQHPGLAYLGARWLPDGKRVIVMAVESGQQPKLFLSDLGPGRPIPLTPEGITSWTVSPDGETIVARGSDAAIRFYDLKGAALRQLPALTGSEVVVGWITSGLLVMRLGDASSPLGEIYKVDPLSGRQESWKNILPRDRGGILLFVSFRVTPDGQSMAYTWARALSNLYIADGLV